MKIPHFLSFVIACALGIPLLSSAEEPYHLAKVISIGGEGGWDCLSVDEAARRLYVTHSTQIVVIDLNKNEVAGNIEDTPGVHGFAVASEFGKGFSSNGKENKSSIVDLQSLKTLSKVDTGANPDIILYEPSQKEIYCFNGKGNSVTVLNAKSEDMVTTITLPGKPEFAACDPTAGKVYCNIEDKNEVAVLDVKTHTVETAWPIAPGESASGLAIDLVHHRLFLGCDNKLMVMMDSTNGKVLGSVPIGDHVDGTAFDPGTGFAFASCGSGATTIATEAIPGTLTTVQTLTTESGARTMALDPTTHRIYLASAQFEPLTAAPTAGKWQRPKMVPNTFKVLVYEMGKMTDH